MLNKLSLISLFLLITNLEAQAPRNTTVDFKSCVPTTEICGNGVDDDCTGGDASCSNSDNDNDGYSNSLDCDPNDHFVYSGVSVSCSANCGEGVKTCNSDGSFSSCTCTPLCEAKGAGRCYYIDPVNGNDNNTGTFNSKLKSLRRLASYYAGAAIPSNKIDLNPGDVIYMFSGIYKDEYVSDGMSHVMKLMGIRGNASAPIVFKAYPGQVPVISPATAARGITIHSGSYLVFDGFQIKGAFHAGLAAFDSDHLTISNLKVYDTKGVDNDNLAGLYMTYVTQLEVKNSELHDNYDRDCFDTGGQKTENSRNMVLFKGGDVKIHHNYFYQTPSRTAAKTGSCLVYKHSQSLVGGIFEVNNNVFKNCFFTAIGNGGYGGRFHHNLILDSDTAVMVKDMGGFANGQDNLAEYNTIINSTAFEFNPSQFIEQNYPYGNFQFRNNIVSDNRSYSSDAGGIFTVDIYGSNTSYSTTMSSNLLSTSNNCFYSSSGPAQFAFFSSNSSPVRSQGGLYNLTSWKGLGFDAGSAEANPALGSPLYRTVVSACAGKGY